MSRFTAYTGIASCLVLYGAILGQFAGGTGEGWRYLLLCSLILSGTACVGVVIDTARWAYKKVRGPRPRPLTPAELILGRHEPFVER